MKVLAIDLGKFKSVACLFDTDTNQAEYKTVIMERNTIVDLLERSQPHKVVIETSNNSNWVYDICQEKGYTAVVANLNQEVGQWRNVKQKTDKDDALKLVKLAALDQISPVYLPSPETRQYRQLVKYRKKLV